MYRNQFIADCCQYRLRPAVAIFSRLSARNMKLTRDRWTSCLSKACHCGFNVTFTQTHNGRSLTRVLNIRPQAHINSQHSRPIFSVLRSRTVTRYTSARESSLWKPPKMEQAQGENRTYARKAPKAARQVRVAAVVDEEFTRKGKGKWRWRSGRQLKTPWS